MIVGGLGEDVVHVVKRVLGDQGDQRARREGEVRAIDARVALCACSGVSPRCTPMRGNRGYRRRCGPYGKTRHRLSVRSARPS